MPAIFNPPTRGEEFVLRIALPDMQVAGGFQINPPIEAGDFKVDADGSGLFDLETLPIVQPANSVLVKIALSAAEMDGAIITIVGIDQTANKEWADFVLSIPTTAPNIRRRA